MTTPNPVAAWLAKPHTMTWFQMVRTGKVPPDVLATVNPEREPRTPDTAMHVATQLAQIHTHWPPIDDYIAAHPCPNCKAAAYVPCTISRGTQHSTRQDRGIRHYSKDVGNAPWGEDRIPRLS